MVRPISHPWAAISQNNCISKLIRRIKSVACACAFICSRRLVMPCTRDISFRSSLIFAMILKSVLSDALSTLIFTVVVVILKVLNPSFLQSSSEVASCRSDYRLKPDWTWISWTHASRDWWSSLHCCVPEQSLNCWCEAQTVVQQIHKTRTYG